MGDLGGVEEIRLVRDDLEVLVCLLAREMQDE